MTEIRFAGPAAGSGLNLTNVTVGAESGSANVTAFKQPLNPTIMAFITGGQRVGDTLALDESAISGIISRQWRISGGADLGTAATQDSTGYGGQYIECYIVCAQGTFVTPAVLVYTDMMDASHNTADDAFLAIFPHNDTTHVAVSDGDWTSSTTWLNGLRPTAGARVLIPRGVTVRYDWNKYRRLDRIRVDGVLNFARDQSTRMLVETLKATRGGKIIIGTEVEPIPPQYTVDICVSNRDYQTSAVEPTVIDTARDTQIMSRGIIYQGEFSAYGARKDHAIKTAIGGAPMVGDTSLVLAKITSGWQVGDTIVIPGTRVINLNSETEARVITAINGGMISWDTPLLYNHDKQNDVSLRDDLQPTIGNITRNIKIHSENSKQSAEMNGHVMAVHMHSKTDLNYVEITDCGRTAKSDATPTGHINESTDFRFFDADTSAWVTEPLSGKSNRNGRYGLHLHFSGQDEDDPAKVTGCVINGSPGWGYTNHGSRVHFAKNCAYRFAASGFVGETGNETGYLFDNWSVYSINKAAGSPKDAEAVVGQRGDFARRGYGMYDNGREVRYFGNYGGDVSVGHVKHHRWQNDSFVLPIDHNRSELSIQGLGGATSLDDVMAPVDSPIHSHVANEFVGVVVSGMFITKANPTQGHGWTNVIADLLVWGFGSSGFRAEYIAQYTVLRGDFLPTGGATLPKGITFGQNTLQVAAVNCRTEGCDIDVSFSTVETTDNTTVVGSYGSDNPRAMVIGHERVGGTPVIYHPTTAFSHLHEVAEELTPIEPSFLLPFIVGRNETGSGGALTNVVTGTLSDSVSAAGVLPKPGDEAGVVRASSSANFRARVSTYLEGRDNGYYMYNGTPIVLMEMFFGDRASGVPTKTWNAMELTYGPTGPNRGNFTLAASPPVVTGVPSISTAVNNAGSVDLATFISDPENGNLTISQSRRNARHGTIIINGTVISFVPDLDFIGTGECSVWVDSDKGQTTRIDIPVDVGVTPAQAIVAGDWTLGQAAGDAVLLTLGSMPDTGGRELRKVEYTTDGGSNWKRLCYKWVAGGHIVSTDSSDVALTSSQTLADVQLRYVTDRADLIGSDSKSITLD